jgi:hypothetical protein
MVNNNRLDDETIRPVGTQSIGTGVGTLLVCGFTTNKLYKSVDNGATWDAGVQLPTTSAGGVVQLANGWLLVCDDTATSKIYKSTDNGDTWDSGTALASLLTSIRQLANGDVVCVSRSTDRIYTSADNGATWDAGVVVGGTILQEVIQLADGSLMLSAFSSGKVHKSADNGATWDAGVAVASSIRGLCQLPNGDILCAGNTVLYKSVDNGATWSEVVTVIDLNSRLFYMNGFVYASSFTDNKIFRSADSGTTWVQVGSTTSTGTKGFGTLSLERLPIVVPSRATGILMQCSEADSVITWSTDATSTGFKLCNNMKPFSLRFDPTQTTTLYISLYLGQKVKYLFFTS